MGTPATSMSALGVWSVSGRRRVPSPAARIMASTSALLLMGGGRLRARPGARLAVLQRHLHVGIGTAQVPRQSLGEVDRAVLATRATEVHGQAVEAAPLVLLHLRVHQVAHAPP